MKSKAYIPTDGKKRCKWVLGGNALYFDYHDTEWGVPVHDDRRHFEFLILEGVQAGLSWAIVLNKRENYRKAFDDFDPIKIAAYSENKIKNLLEDKGLVRNNLKMAAAVNNAQCFLKLQEAHGSFDNFIWDFVGGAPIQGSVTVPTMSIESEQLSKTLKQYGFKFVGPTVIYAHMQAVGMINDHAPECFRRSYCCELS